MRTPALVLIALSSAAVISGCKGDETAIQPDTFDWTDTNEIVDVDGDGIPSDDGDCDDDDAQVHPGAVELCNGVDDDCNQIADEGLADGDRDGVCDALDTEECDGLDNDGDGGIDDGFPDADGDGIADCAGAEACNGRDDNGDGTIDEGFDLDADGTTSCGGDCDDADADIHPGVPDVDANRIDDDCDGFIDENAWEPGDVVISEFLADPSVPDSQGEWFELVNLSGRTATFSGLGAATEFGSTILTSDPLVVVPSYGVRVVAADADPMLNGSVDADYEWSGMFLGNESGWLEIFVVDDDGNHVTLDRIEWSTETGWVRPEGASRALDPDDLDASSNDTGSVWCAAADPWTLVGDLGSPGVENPICTTIDHDGDGQDIAHGDCDDNDPRRWLGGPEVDAFVDNDCDGVVEVGPIASLELGAATDATACGDIELDASGTTDIDGPLPLTYEWSVTSAPADALRGTPEIVDLGGGLARFEPDAVGTWDFSVTALDGGLARSAPVSLSVSVGAAGVNVAPVADAGQSQEIAVAAECRNDQFNGWVCDPCPDVQFTLDGTGSSDPDGDAVTWHWEVNQSWAILADAETANPTVTIGSQTAAPGTEAVRTVFLSLEVRDCAGDVSPQDITAVTYRCTAASE